MKEVVPVLGAVLAAGAGAVLPVSGHPLRLAGELVARLLLRLGPALLGPTVLPDNLFRFLISVISMDIMIIIE